MLLNQDQDLLADLSIAICSSFHHSDQGEKGAQGENLEEKNAEQAQVLLCCTVRPGKFHKPRSPERAWFLGGMQ